MKFLNFKEHLLNIFFLGLIIPVLGSLASITFFPEWRLVYLPIHSLIEGLGGFIALTLAAILLAVYKRKLENVENIWISFALICMGTLDIFHASLGPGKLFVWLHSVAQFLGGLFFAFVWFSKPVKVDSNIVSLPISVFAGAFILGLVSLAYPEYMPEMVNDGKFSILAQALNILGGLGFLLAAGFFIKEFYFRRRLNDYLFAIHCTLFGSAGVLFELSQLWDAAWWWWHLLRLLAYSAGLVLVISSFKETEETLGEHQKFLSSIIDNLRDGLINIDGNGVIKLFNPEAEKIFGYSAKETIGRNVTELMPEVYRKKHLEKLEKAVKDSEYKIIKTTIEFEGLRKDGSTFPVELGLTRLSASGLPEFVALVRDVSKQKAWAEEILEAKLNAVTVQKEAEKANAAKSKFLANISHEIRTPMNSILGYSQILLRKKNLDSEQRRALDIIDNNGKNLLEMLNEVLDISKIEAGKMDLQINNFDLNSLINGIADMFELRCRQKQLTWKVEGLKGACFVSGDENKLRAILINLIGNSVKFTDRGEIVFKVIPLEQEQFLFEVVDTGSGIAAKDQRHILEPFYQEDSGAKKGGTGLGLAISNKQLKLMGSELKLESELGKGSCFHFILQLPKAVDEVLEQNDRAQNVLYLAKGSKVKALVVDDIKENRDLLTGFLSDLKVDVIQAVDGKDGLEKVRKHLPDIIFMDIRMPVMDGKEAIEIIQKEFGKDRFKIVVITASVLKSEENSYKEMGIHEFITKPFRLNKIIHCIDKLLEVDFEYRDEEPPNEDASKQCSLGMDTPDYSKICLPKDLYSKLKVASEINSITEIEKTVNILQNMDENCIKLAAQIERYMEKYEMGPILEIVEKLNFEKK